MNTCPLLGEIEFLNIPDLEGSHPTRAAILYFCSLL